MSTITDLFSIRIGFGRKGVFIEQLEKSINLLIADEKTPLKEDYNFSQYALMSMEGILDKEGIIKENIYYIVQPSFYYRNVLSFPFHDRQKIDGVIKFEVGDFLPSQDIEYITDFLTLSEQEDGSLTEVLSFTIEKAHILGILERFGRYRENLRAVIPFDVAVFHYVTQIIDKQSYIFIDIQNDVLYIQEVKNNKIRNIIYIKKQTEEQYRNSSVSQLLILLRESDSSSVWVNTRNSADEGFRLLNNQLFEELKLSWRMLPVGESEGGAAKGVSSEMVSLLGTLNSINQPASKRVNFLKEEFKPRLKGYVRIKDFAFAGALLLVLLLISLSNLFIDVRFKKNQVIELQKGIDELSTKVFGVPQLKGNEVQGFLEDLQKKIGLIERSIGRRYSGIALLRELSTYLPEDVVIEYTDIIIEPDHIKFAGKARTFSDIDRIKESLSVSEYISEVEVTNTGTTGSSEGFAVTFIFDISIKENLFGSEKSTEKSFK